MSKVESRSEKWNVEGGMVEPFVEPIGYWLLAVGCWLLAIGYSTIDCVRCL